MYELLERNINQASAPEWSAAFPEMQEAFSKLKEKLAEIRNAEMIYDTNLKIFKRRHPTLPKKLSLQDKRLVQNQVNAVETMIKASEELRLLTDGFFETIAQPALFKVFMRYMGEDEQTQDGVRQAAAEFFENYGNIFDSPGEMRKAAGKKPLSKKDDEVWESAHSDEIERYHREGDLINQRFAELGGIHSLVEHPERLAAIQQDVDPAYAALFAISRTVATTGVLAKEMEKGFSQRVVAFYKGAYPDLGEKRGR
jgi:hypothetical protein